MPRRRGASRSGPGLSGRIWVGFAVILLFCVPWYFPAGGAVRPQIWAFPFWGFVIVLFYLALAIYTAWVYLAGWKSGKAK